MELIEKFKSIFFDDEQKEKEEVETLSVQEIQENPEEQEEQVKESYIATVVDVANFMDRDLSNLFEKLFIITNNTNADIIAIINIHRKEIIEKIETIANIFKKFSVLVYFATSETDIEIAKFTIRKVNLGLGKVLVATGDFSLIQSIASFISSDKVGFFIDKNNMPSQIHSLTQIGYSVRIADIISKKEGLIRRLIHVSPNQIRRARNYNLPDEIEEKILSVLPKTTEELKTYIEQNNLMNNIDNYKIELASLAIRNKVKFFHDKEKNIVTVLPASSKQEN